MKLKFLYIDIMRDYVWVFYHRWILHVGKKINTLACRHRNPFFILTPKLLARQTDTQEMGMLLQSKYFYVGLGFVSAMFVILTAILFFI